MADSTITGLPNATTPLSGTERVPMDQGGVTVDAAVSDIRATPLTTKGDLFTRDGSGNNARLGVSGTNGRLLSEDSTQTLGMRWIDPPTNSGASSQVRAYRSTALSLADSTPTAIGLDGETFDSDSCHDNSTNNSRLTCKVAGTYVIAGTTSFVVNAGGIREVALRLNGTTTIAASNARASSTDYTKVNVATVYTLAVNDYVEMIATQDCGASLALLTGDDKTWLAMTIGPAGAAGATGATGATGSTGATGAGVPTGGTTGQVLSKIDATDYNTQWSTPSGGGGGSGDAQVCHGRLTLTSGIPVTTSDVTGATSIYFTPYGGNTVGLYVSGAWTLTSFTEKTLALGTLAAAFQAYDIFGYSNAGALALEMLEWANATVTMTIASPGVATWTGGPIVNGDVVILTTTGALPTGLSANTRYYAVGTSGSTFQLAAAPGGTAINTSGSQSGTHTAHTSNHRATALTTQDGVLVKSGDATRRYLGTFVSTSTTMTEDSAAKRYLFNEYNRVYRSLMSATETTDSWSYNTAAFRQANANAINLLDYVDGDGSVFVEASVSGAFSSSGSGFIAVGIGIDSTTSNSAQTRGSWCSNSIYALPRADYKGRPGLGRHFLAWLEYGMGSGTNVWYGDNGIPSVLQTGIAGSAQM